MRERARQDTVSDVCTHLASGAVLGALLALSLIVGNKSIFAAITNSGNPGLFVAFLVLCIAASVSIGSAISGFILTSVEKSK